MKAKPVLQKQANSADGKKLVENFLMRHTNKRAYNHPSSEASI